MSRLCFFLISFLFLASTGSGQNQPDQRPKVGLVLSGGGAKGIAHIPLLKLIDSLNIHVDYITGTSMGSVVGGFYACGYKGAEIDELIKRVGSNVLLSNQLSLDAINIEAKDEFGRYHVKLPTTKTLKPKLPPR